MWRKFLIILFLVIGIFFSQIYNWYAASEKFIMRDYVSAINGLDQNVQRWDFYILYIDENIEAQKQNDKYLKKLINATDTMLWRLWDSQRDRIRSYIVSYIWQKARYELHLLKLQQLNENQVSRTWEWITITIIGDKRCITCVTQDILGQLKEAPFLDDADFLIKDFSDEWISQFLQENNITKLPQALFSTNQLWDGWQISPFLIKLNNDEYLLEIGEAASFDPFSPRSERWFQMVDKDILTQIQQMSYVKWQLNTPLTWIEYSDFWCPFCRRMRVEDKTVESILNEFPNIINNRFQHLAFRNKEVPESIECIAEQAWGSAFKKLITQSFESNASTYADVLNLTEALNISYSTSEYNNCISDGRMQTKIDTQMEMGQNIFWLRWTPGNIIVNNQTWEYEVINWAYPASYFRDTIERLR